jgi:hypothetical protein
MSYRPFLEKSNKPTEKALEDALGSAYAYYNLVVDLAGSYTKEWVYAKSSGWILKISDRKKSFINLIPLKNGFKVSSAIQENERKAFLSDKDVQILHSKILSSKKHMEGFALNFDIVNRNEFQLLELFIRKLIIFRA